MQTLTKKQKKNSNTVLSCKPFTTKWRLAPELATLTCCYVTVVSCPIYVLAIFSIILKARSCLIMKTVGDNPAYLKTSKNCFWSKVELANLQVKLSVFLMCRNERKISRILATRGNAEHIS